MTSYLQIAAWNINGLASNKNEVEILMVQHRLDILLISEAHCTSATCIRFPNYYCYHTPHPDGTSHAGTAVIVKKTIKHHVLPSYKQDFLQATTILVEDSTGYLNVSAVYCPPKYNINESMFSHFFSTLGNRFVVGVTGTQNIHFGVRD